ncbi:MAG: argininosuccinate lyase [Verrucomicrobiales bacterium]|jgi:argininosuccinate lyase|nr:argininosuccinate lyase [Verrucomicrobiales bacterium]MBP9222231.1 argininosuccinate lyase [Verrucomicrobiales bacterium]HQZ29274.1 argininosuccinate lyase [Verrucomicrobiales bacterium]
MWKGRFQTETSNLVQRYGESISYDWRLYAYDIAGSIAHAAALVDANILTKAEEKAIVRGLNEIKREIETGEFRFKTSLEDIHMNIERALTDKIGAPGAKLHTARSRNDQVALDIRLFCRAESQAIYQRLTTLQNALLTLAVNHPEAVVPGYTHLQRGQPVLFAHHLLAYLEMLERDKQRVRDCYQRINVMPLGSGALAGSTIVLNRKIVAEKLGFPAITQNSMDAVSDRDFVAELLFVISLAGVHLSRLSEDVILWATAEFGFIELSDAHTTGSSLMPQKKNPDVAELTRGKTGRLIGNLVGLLTTIKGLPMTYNRDLQEDKEPLFDSIDQIKLALEVFAEMMIVAKVREDRTLAATSDPFLLATDLADYLVLKGVPFRDAHEVIGKLTAFSLTEKRGFPDLSLEEYRQFSPVFEPDLFKVLDLKTALKARKAIGAPSPANVGAQITRWQKRLHAAAPFA